jgi:hypothetical protein
MTHIKVANTQYKANTLDKVDTQYVGNTPYNDNAPLRGGNVLLTQPQLENDI